MNHHPPFLSMKAIAMYVLCAIVISSMTGWFARRASADDTITWQKDPAVAQITACDPSSPDCPTTPVDLGNGVWEGGIVLTEIMNNQSDPHGLGGYQLNVSYDPFVFQDAQIVDAGAINDGGLRSTTCSPTPPMAGNIGIICTSTGPFGVGAVWTGPMVMAHVTLKLQPGVYSTIQSGPNGGIVTTVSDSVRVTNTCGQPLNDGTLEPVPGQIECQGNLLPGLGANGTVLNPGQSTITIVRPPTTPTPTATQISTATPTATPFTPSPTSTTTPVTPTTPTSTPVTPMPTSTATPLTPTSTPVTPAPSSTATPLTPTSTPAVSPSSTSTPATPTSTPATATPCLDRTLGYWMNHPNAWPVDSLVLGAHTYTKSELLAILRTPDGGDASLILAHQLIAAKLNVAAGAQYSAPGAITLGDGVLGRYQGALPYGVAPSSPDGQSMVLLATQLDNANSVCENGATPAASPTPVNNVLGRTRRNSPSGLPFTGQANPFRHGAEGWIIAAMAVVIVSLLIVLVRQAIRGEEHDE